MVSESVVLQVNGLCFGFPGRPLLDGWSAAWPSGLVLVRGDESSGKTTLLRLLAGMLPVQAGSIALNGVVLQDAPQAYQRQVFWLDPRATLADDVTARAWLAAQSTQHAHWNADALAAHVAGFALEPHLDKTFPMLSTGSRRKVGLAAALASGAELTLIDEPEAGLDKASIQYLAQALGQASAAPGRVVVVAHYEALAGAPWRQVVDLP